MDEERAGIDADAAAEADEAAEAGASKILDLDEFLRMLPYLDSADLLAISATYEQADATSRDAARAAASTIANRDGLIDELGRIQGSIIQWAGADISRSSAVTLAGVRPDQVLGDIRMQAVPPLLDAVTALLLKETLPESHRDLLLEPLGAAVG